MVDNIFLTIGRTAILRSGHAESAPPPPIWGVGQLWTKLHTGE